METKIELGMRVKDKVTGFVGIAIARCVYLNGCVQLQISPKIDANGAVRNMWIDEVQLVKVDNGILPKSEPKSKKEKEYIFDPHGGMRSHPKE